MQRYAIIDAHLFCSENIHKNSNKYFEGTSAISINDFAMFIELYVQ